MKNNTIKYPKPVSETELYNNKMVLTDSVNRQTKILEQIKILKKEYFSMQGANGYLIDVCNFLATKNPKLFWQNPEFTHVSIRLSTTDFNEHALGDYQNQLQSLKDQVYKFRKENKQKILPLDLNMDILIEPIRIYPIYSNKQNDYFGILSNNPKKTYEYGKLKNVKNTKLVGYQIDIYKNLWKSILTENPNNYFLYPSHLHAKMVHAINECKDKQDFIELGIFGNVYNYRKLFLYMQMHNNGKSDELVYNIYDLTLECLPENIKKQANGQYCLKDKKQIFNFIKKGVKLFNYMGQNGLLTGSKLVPTLLYLQGNYVHIPVERNYNKIKNSDIPTLTIK